MSAHPLGPSEIYPALATGVSARMINLRTGVRVRVAESGPRDGPPVLMLHGWGASLYAFRHGLELLAAQGFRVIAPDLRGFGLSDHPAHPGAYSLDAYLGDLDALLDALELERLGLVGHSMGGGLSLRFALKNPDRLYALALINPTGLVHATPLSVTRVAPVWVAEAIGEHMVPRWLIRVILERVAYGDPSRLTPRDIEEYWAPTQIPGYTRTVRRTASEFDWTPLSEGEAQSLSVPTAVVLGTSDRLVWHAGPAARRLRGAGVHEVRGGHCVHEERPDEVFRILGDLFSRRATG